MCIAHRELREIIKKRNVDHVISGTEIFPRISSKLPFFSSSVRVVSKASLTSKLNYLFERENSDLRDIHYIITENRWLACSSNGAAVTNYIFITYLYITLISAWNCDTFFSTLSVPSDY